ncbi:hypothetical protein FEZ40_11050 [Lacticaseibacillus paracasei]|nr:hypothetical protein FEZ40_11050 [Lacticaseibacillus paracasei]
MMVISKIISRGHQSDVAVITRSPAQQPACKDLERNGHNPTITFKAAYTPVSTALAHAQS